MQGDSWLDTEIRVFAQYLTGTAATDYVRTRYLQAVSGTLGRRLLARDPFDTLLLGVARRHPLLTRVADLYSRLLRADSALRRRLVLLLAILETDAATVERMDRPDCAGMAGFVLGMCLRGTASVLLLLPALPVLLPLHRVLGRARRTPREG